MNKELLRRSELFAGLSEPDLDWLIEQGEPLSLAAGEVLFGEGMAGDAAFIVVDGELEVKKQSDTQHILIAVREPGEVLGEMALLDNTPRMATVRATCPSHLLKIRGDTFQQLLSQKPSAALAILHTVSKRLRQNEALLRQSEKMAALGTLTAGLAHELNNPVTAVSRNVDQMRSALQGWVKTSIDLDHCTLTARQKSLIHDLEAAYRTRPAADFEPDPLRQSDRESSLQAWLEGIGFEEAWELSPTLAACQWEIESLQKLQAEFTPETLRLVVKWLAAGCGVNTLLDETRMAAGRVSEIVKSVKAYSFLDQAPVQEVDVQEGLENTLIILRHKTKMGIKIQREYKSDLPHIEAHGGELNQVWTNIMDNAIDAMEGKGELTVRTYIDDGQVIVEIEDTGGGIQSKIQDRIFEPFFTTKPPGKGTGLGLHIAYTIVNNHHGQITVKSKPGKTCFRVALPIQLPH